MNRSGISTSLTDFPYLVTATLTTSTFIIGFVLGRKLNTNFRRIKSLATVEPTKLALVVRNDLNMGRGLLHRVFFVYFRNILSCSYTRTKMYLTEVYLFIVKMLLPFIGLLIPSFTFFFFSFAFSYL